MGPIAGVRRCDHTKNILSDRQVQGMVSGIISLTSQMQCKREDVFYYS